MPGLIQDCLTLNNENGPTLTGTTEDPGKERFSPYCQIEGRMARLVVHARSDINFVLQAKWSNKPYSRDEGWMLGKLNQSILVQAGVPRLEFIVILGKYLTIECTGTFAEPDSTYFDVTVFGIEIE